MLFRLMRLTALASTIIYPQLSDISAQFPHVAPSLIGNDIAYPAMMRFLPAGFLGLVVAGTLAAVGEGVDAGAAIVRVHDVAATRDFLTVRAALRGEVDVPEPQVHRHELFDDPEWQPLGEVEDSGDGGNEPARLQARDMLSRRHDRNGEAAFAELQLSFDAT